MKLSIITPVYNGAATIEKTIRSVISQPHSVELEYLIIDGCSTDQTLEITQRYADSIDRIISEADAGAYDAMNKGVQLATGEVIGIINADDWYNPGAFQQVEQAFAQDPTIDVLYSPIDNYYEGTFVATFEPGQLEKLPIRFTLNHPSCFIRKSAYDRVGRYDLTYKIAADYDLILRLYQQGCRFQSLPQPLAAYSLNGMSSSTNLFDRLKLIRECWQVGEHPALSDADRRDRQKAYAAWILNEIVALPARRLLKPPAARKLKQVLTQFIRKPVSDAYGKW